MTLEPMRDLVLLNSYLDQLPEASSFVALKAPKRGANRESLADANNGLRRWFVDQLAATSESLAAGWRYGCLLFNNCCYICGNPFKDGEVPQADHVVPPKHGGSTNAGNMLPAHRECNNDKADTLPDVYFVDKPLTLMLIKHFQNRFSYVPSTDVYSLANEKVDECITAIKQELIHTRNVREGQSDVEDEVFELTTALTSPQVNNYLRALDYYFEVNSFVPTARIKMRNSSRRILQAWLSSHEAEDLFSSDEQTVRKFIEDYFKSLTDHPDSFNRAHRAFRILSEVFASKSLQNIYSSGAPVLLSELRETHEYKDGLWRPLVVNA